MTPALSDFPSGPFLFGGLGILLEWLAYAQVCGARFRAWSAWAALLWALMYAGLEAWTAALTMGATAFRTWLSATDADRPQHGLALVFVALFFGLTLLSWQGLVSLLPAFAVINTTLALFYLKNLRMRQALLASSLAWISNDVLWSAWPALLAETVAVGINLRTIRRMGSLKSSGC